MKLENCSIEEFYLRVSDKPLICFGAGSLLKNYKFQVKCPARFTSGKIIFVDNDRSKWGKTIHVWNESFIVYPPNKISEHSNLLILITCGARNAFHIINQIRNMKIPDESACYIFDVMYRNPAADIHLTFQTYTKCDKFVNYKSYLAPYKNKYKNERCFVLGNGPSLKVEDLERLKDEYTFASNGIYHLFEKTDWRPSFYSACDIYAFDFTVIDSMYQDGITAFIPIESVVMQGVILKNVLFYDTLMPETDYDKTGMPQKISPCFSSDIVKGVFCNTTITYMLLQLAVSMGFKKIYLLGVDHTAYKKSNHFYEKSFNEASSIDSKISQSFSKEIIDGAYKAADGFAKGHNIEILDATRNGQLKVFPKINFDALFE